MKDSIVVSILSTPIALMGLLKQPRRLFLKFDNRTVASHPSVRDEFFTKLCVPSQNILRIENFQAPQVFL